MLFVRLLSSRLSSTAGIAALRIALYFILIAATAGLLWAGISNIWRENVCHVADEHVPAYADIVAGLAGAEIGYLVENPLDIRPIDRTRIIHMNWEVAPGAVTPITVEEIGEWRGAIVGPANAMSQMESCYEQNGFAIMAHNEFAVLRARYELFAEPRESHSEVKVTIGGFWGVIVALAMLFMLWRWARVRLPLHPLWVFAALIVFAALGSVALRFGLTAPNGLGTYAGKARLFILAHGIPDGFWSSCAYSVYQPSYPFAMVVFAFVFFVVGDSFDVFWLQLFVPFVLSLIFIELAGRRLMAFALAVSYVLCPLAIKLAIGFYAEPLCALVLILGWKNLRVGKPIVGWALIGMAGLVRHEGLLIAVILCSVYMILKRSFKWKFFLLASGPGALWQLLMLVLGAHLQGYDFSQAPSLSGIVMGGVEAVRNLVIGRNGSMIGTLAILMLLTRRNNATDWTIIVSFSLMISASVVLLSFSETCEFSWLVETVVGRFLWLAAAIPVCEASCVLQSRENVFATPRS